MKHIILVIFVAIVSACSVLPQKNPPALPPDPPKQVEVVVTKKCIESVPEIPRTHRNADLAEMHGYQFLSAIHQDRLELLIYAEKANALLQGCFYE